MEWRDEATGLHCLITRNQYFGNLCGYVAVPPQHPLHGVCAEDAGLSAHREVNYSSACSGKICHDPPDGESDNVWWFGFDCGHLHDYMPGLNARSRDLQHFLNDGTNTYRDLEYVKAQCRELARQIGERR